MSRRAKLTSPNDSLELLLDTISNVFGAIILMAILVVLQTQATVQQIPNEDDEEASKRALDGKRLAFEEKRLKDRLKALEAAGPIPRPPHSPRAATIEERKQAFQVAISKAQQDLEAAKKERADDPREIEALDDKIKAAGDELREEQKKLAALTRTGAVQSRSTKTVRLPFRHNRSRFLRQRQYYVRGDKVWPLPDQCTSRPAPKVRNGRLYSPIEEQGFVITEAKESTRPVLDTMSVRTPKTHFVSFWVAANSESFVTFQRLRAAFVAKGFEYSVGTFPLERGLILFPGTPEVE